MRLQLVAGAFAGVLGGLLGFVRTAHADGSLTERDVYYKERSTRVIQPMLDGIFDAGERGLITAHFLVDAITSASAGSGAANGVAFTERRYEAGGGYTHELDGPRGSWVDKIRVGGDAKYSTESDYTSLYGGVRGEADVAQKNATIGLGIGYSDDHADNAGAQGPMGGPPLVCDSAKPTVTASNCPVDTRVINATASQILSRNAVAALTYDLERVTGFQSNAYRTVVTESGLLPESHPDERLRQAIAASARIFVPASRTTIIPAYRYYRQTASYFYEPRYGVIDTTQVHYITDDPKMSAFDGELMEAKLGIYGSEFDLTGNWAAARFEGILTYIVQNNRFEIGRAHV